MNFSISAKTKKQITRFLFHLLAIILAVIWLIPIASTLFTSLRTEREIAQEGLWSIPTTLHWETYVHVWREIIPYFINSVIITVPSAILSVLIACLAAYVLARKRFKGDRLILLFFLAGMMIPFVAVIVPLFRLMRDVGLYNTHLAQILVNISFGIPGTLFVLRYFFITIPAELEDAARVDGCSEFGILLKIIMPLAMPAVITMTAFQFIWIWNTLIWGLALAINDRAQPIMVGLLSLRGRYAIAWNIQAAGALISVILPLCVFLFLQKYFSKGLVMGAGIKG